MAIFYVDQDASGLQEGTSWTNAYTDLQDALVVVTANDEIWVANGTYKPTDDFNRDISFFIPSGVEIYGGFVGGETHLEQRDWINNPTILSGNIGSENIRTDNTYHVVSVSDSIDTTILDGLTISDGNADGTDSSGRDDGGGIVGFGNSNATFTLKNLIVSNNLATGFGGGFYLEGGNYNFINVTFKNNFANEGAENIYASVDSLTVENVLFFGNESQSGEAIVLQDNSGFDNNQANQGGSITISIFTGNNDDANSLNTTINRFQNANIPGTYLFAGEEESQGIRDNFPNFDEEGLAFNVAVEPGDDLIPLYRFQSTRTPGAYLFAGEEERQSINQNFAEDFNEEGLAFYVYGAGSGLGTTFYRFHNDNRPGTYLFAGPEEREGILDNFPNFTEEGIAFEVSA